tara:strand:+ start:524 stop:1153 length:630 start_codon:yes stop_codon:yes gene_type:complete
VATAALGYRRVSAVWVLALQAPQTLREEVEMSKETGINGPTITVDHINSVIVDEQYHVFAGTTLTVCVLTLRNGFTVTGESACVDPANFDAEKGRHYAREQAFGKIWMLEGYLLRDQLHQSAATAPVPIEGKPGFMTYQGKPTTRDAYCVQPGDVIESAGEATYRTVIEGKAVEFKAYEQVNVGDYIVYLTDSDIYHCRADVFHERNIV